MLHILPTRGDHTLTHDEVAKLQSTICKSNEGRTPKNSLAAKAQSVMDRHTHEETSDPIVTQLFHNYGVTVISKGVAKKIVSTAAKTNQGRIKKDSFAARVQSAADSNVNTMQSTKEKTGEELLTMLEVRRPHPITKHFAKSLQSTEASLHHGVIKKGSEAALAQSAVDKMEYIEHMRSMSSSVDTLDSSASKKNKKRHHKKTRAGPTAGKSISVSRSMSSGGVGSDED